ncbi:MAG: enoyl-CoA hydratase-related protein [Myxococcota bacterium]
MSLLLREDRGIAAWLTLNRPDAANALSRPLVLALREQIERLSTDANVRAVVVTGAGGRFCAGADLKERRGFTQGETRAFVDTLNGAFDALEALPQVTIAAIDGACFGGGLELALACDLRVATPAAQLGLTEVRVGIMPGAGGTRRLPRAVGHARAAELMLLGRRISAERALAIGLVHEVAADLRGAVDAIVGEIKGCAPLGVDGAKRALRGAASEREGYERVLASEDREEGLRAFAEKRAPEFKGR